MAQAEGGLTLVADVGGTNTRVALARGRSVREDSIRRYANSEHPDIEQVLRRYLSESGDVRPEAACIAAAGPVRDGRVTMTNIDHWPTIDKETLSRATGAGTVAILNDLQAQGHALGYIDASRIKTIIPFPVAGPHAAKLVIGVGTGFNAAPVFDAEGGRLVTPSESGHVNLPLRSPADIRLAAWLDENRGFPSVEEVLSGRGLANVYTWLFDEDGRPAESLGKTGTVSSVEVLEWLAAGEYRAIRAARMFARMLGAVAGNLALTQLPFGGVWLAGGMARVIAPYLVEFGFVEAFHDKGRFAGFMDSFGVGVVDDDDAALTGSAAHLVGLMRAGHSSA